MYFFWISYCSCMLTVILRLSVQIKLVARALSGLNCAAAKMRTFFFLVPCGIQERTVNVSYGCTPVSEFVLISLPLFFCI